MTYARVTIAQKGERFRALHQSGTFVIPNPWDAGTARTLADIGFQALATTSAGAAMALGRPDGQAALTREETLDNAALITAATPLPTSADLENGFGDSPDDCAMTIRAGASVGLVGGSIEDCTGRADDLLYSFDESVARVRAAVAAARALPHDFILVGRAEGVLYKRYDLDEAIRRLVAYAEVGADCVYVPGIRTADDIARVVKTVAPTPVNVLIGGDFGLSVPDLARLGVRRVSVGSAMARVAYSAFRKSAEDIFSVARFSSFAPNDTYASVNERFARWESD